MSLQLLAGGGSMLFLLGDECMWIFQLYIPKNSAVLLVEYWETEIQLTRTKD